MEKSRSDLSNNKSSRATGFKLVIWRWFFHPCWPSLRMYLITLVEYDLPLLTGQQEEFRLWHGHIAILSFHPRTSCNSSARLHFHGHHLKKQDAVAKSPSTQTTSPTEAATISLGFSLFLENANEAGDFPLFEKLKYADTLQKHPAGRFSARVFSLFFFHTSGMGSSFSVVFTMFFLFHVLFWCLKCCHLQW